MTMTIEAPEQTSTTEQRPVLEIPLSTAIQSAAAMLTSASKDDITPILTAAHFDGADMIATDRYKVARFPMPTKPATEDRRVTLGAAFLIPRAALEWVAKVTTKSLRAPHMVDTYTIRYEATPDAKGRAGVPGTVAVSVVDYAGKTERSQAFDGITGNFPPVARLFPGEDAQPAAITQAFNPAYMIEILNYCKKFSDRGAPFKMAFYGDGDQRKMNPALIEGAGASFLIQPNLILR